MPATANKARNVATAMACLLAVLAGSVCVPAAWAGVTSGQVNRGIDKARKAILDAQEDNGAWRDYGHKGGSTALALLSLLNAGASPNDPAIEKGLATLVRVANERTYVVSLKAQVFAAIVEAKPAYRRHLATAAAWLASTQLKNGMWSYGTYQGKLRGSGDNSNTQFALLGLHEAAKAGVTIPAEVWQRSSRHFTNTQNRDGGWAYRDYRSFRGRVVSKSYGSMTAAAVASLYICGQRLHVSARKAFLHGAYPGCGKYQQNPVLAKGLEWMAKNFSVTENPGKGKTWLHYYLYGMERVGMISGLRNLGRHDWYREGAGFLVDHQSPDGSWNSRRFQGRLLGIHDTAFGLLFLAKGNRPVIIQKLRWNGRWNRNIHDLENLTNALDDKLGKRTTWQTVTLDLSLAELRVSPILFITGHEFPQFTDAEKDKLRGYVQTGGTILFEACCGSRAYRAGFEALAKDLWPRYPLHELPASHPVFRSYHKLTDRYGLMGIDTGCRTGVFFSPNALSCLWEMQDYADARKKWSELAFQIGTNIAAYATGRENLPDKLDTVELPTGMKKTQRLTEVPRGAVRIARIVHQGDYNADANCLSNLAALLRDKASVDVVARDRHIKATDKALYDYPVVFMQGHYSFEMSDAEVAALRKYLQRGGFLFADACCGRKAFDKSFRALVAKLFPQQKLTPLRKDHPIVSGKVGQPLGELRFRKILADERKQAGITPHRGTTHPPLEAIFLDGRAVLVYSKYDFSCALEGDNPYSCRGYVDADGQRLAVNIVLYAISY